METRASQCHACIYRQNPFLELRQDLFCEPCPQQGSISRVAPLDAGTPVSSSITVMPEMISASAT